MILESFGEGVCVLDADGETAFANSAALKMTGYEPDEFIGKSNHETLRHSRADGTIYSLEDCPLCGAVGDGATYQSSDEVFWGKDGSMLNVGYTSDPVIEDGEVSGAVVIFRDVSERRRASEEVERRFKSLLAESREGLALSEDGKVFEANKSFLRAFGYEYDEVIGMDAAAFVASEDADRVSSQVSSGQMETYEAMGLRKDGTLFPMEVQPREVPYGTREVRMTSVIDLTERKQAQDELRRQRDQYDNLLQALSAVGEGFVIVNDQRITYANEAFSLISGHGLEELMALESLFEIIVPEEKAVAAEHMRQRLSGESVDDYQETVIFHESGRRVNVEIGVKKTDEDAGFIVIARDITSRKQAERELQRSKNSLAAAQRIASFGNWEYEISNDRARWSDELYEIFGFSANEFTPAYRTFFESLHPDDRNLVRDAIRGALDGDGDSGVDFRIVRFNGETRTVHAEYEVVRDASGRPERMVGTVQDITERTKASDSARFLAESGEILATSLDYRATLTRVAHLATPYVADWCAVDVVEEDGSLARLAVAHEDPEKVALAYELERRYPTDPDAPVGVRNVLRTGEPELAPEIPESLLDEAAVDDEHRELLRELDIRSYMIAPLMVRDRKLGALTFVAGESGRSYSTEDLRLAEDLARRAALAIDSAQLYEAAQREITERKRAESELEARAEDLRRSNAELEQFAYVASHDLQEPLRMVSSYTQLLARRYRDSLDEDAQEFIGYAVDGATRMQQLINDLLAYSRVGTRARELTPTDLSGIVEAALANLSVAIEESSAVVTSDELPTVAGDRTQLLQLFQNLIGNAIKFQDGGTPEIHVGAKREDRDWLISVRDNGIGLDPQYAERVFVIFQRLHGRGDYEGTGIGLAVCKKIVERHRGKMWVESTLGAGSTFYFTLRDDISGESAKE